MRLFVGLAERAWVERVAALGPADASLWRPHRRRFRALDPGEPYLLKLHAPEHAVVGAGRFVAAERLPLALAWLAFGAANGAADPDEFRRHVARAAHEPVSPDRPISCVLLDHPAILPRADWLPVPADWRPSVAHGKVYRGAQARALWQEVQARLGERWRPATDDGPGPGRFRLAVAEAYGQRCAVTGERTLAALDVVHLRPPSRGGPNEVGNGLLLRADLARLFEHGLLIVEPDGYVVRVHERVRRLGAGTTAYAQLDGRPLRVLPERFDLLPGPEYLAERASGWAATGR